MPDTRIITFGCRLNSYESEVMKGHAEAAGLKDAVIVNSCAVTSEAVRQARQTIRRLAREEPGAKIIVTGCAAQIDPAQFANMTEVDHVIGNDEKMTASTFTSLMGEQGEPVLVNDIMSVRETAPQFIDGFEGRARAYVQIQNGCDHRCTFCIIPFGRGPSRSVPAGEVVTQIAGLVERGYKEIVLTGVDITDYGHGLPGAMSLGRLVRKILQKVAGLERLRLSSIDVLELDEPLFEAIRDEPRLMPHLHLSLQAGDDMILKRMKRRHLRGDAMELCAKLMALRPDMVFGADLIAGFPTETEEMFENSLRLVDDCDLTYLHVFPFSPRPGTPAARMPQLERAVIKERAARLRQKGAMALDNYLANQEGQRVELLMETGTMGRTRHFAQVEFDGPASAGEIVNACVTGARGGRLLGEQISS